MNEAALAAGYRFASAALDGCDAILLFAQSAARPANVLRAGDAPGGVSTTFDWAALTSTRLTRARSSKPMDKPALPRDFNRTWVVVPANEADGLPGFESSKNGKTGQCCASSPLPTAAGHLNALLNCGCISRDELASCLLPVEWHKEVRPADPVGHPRLDAGRKAGEIKTECRLSAGWWRTSEPSTPDGDAVGQGNDTGSLTPGIGFSSHHPRSNGALAP